MLKRINHIGIVVKNLQEAVDVYSKGLGIRPRTITEIPDVQLKVCVLQVGEIEIELLQYGDSQIPIVKSLKGDQEGLNHICYEVEGFDEVSDRFTKMGFSLVEGFPRNGVHGKIAFFVPPYSSEERIEILEVGARDE